MTWRRKEKKKREGERHEVDEEREEGSSVLSYPEKVSVREVRSK